MASALELTAQNTIMNSAGLTVSPSLLANITAFQNLTTVSLVSNIFTNASTVDANIGGNLIPTLANLGSGVSQAQFLLDFYPGNITATSSGTVSVYASTATPVYGTGIHMDEIVGYTYTPLGNTSSFSRTLHGQASLPFANGMTGFANVFMITYGFANEVFDTVSSVNILQNKTYSQSGLGYNGPLDLATNGIGSDGPLLANVIANWGTMYDIKNIDTFYDPYVFGQNILNQGLGSYGNLSSQLTSVGLNIANLPAIPTAQTTTSSQPSTILSTSFIGTVNLPSVVTVSNTTTVPGSSPQVVTSIYQGISGANLSPIVSATGITTSKTVATLNGYLDFNQVIDTTLISPLANIGITDFPSLSNKLNQVAGKGYFLSWTALAKMLNSITSPTLAYTSSTNANTNVLSSGTISALNAYTGNGSGPFNNPTLPDYLGAVSGIPYTNSIHTLIENYPTYSGTIEPLMRTLDSAVTSYINAYQSALYSNTSTPTTTAVNSAVLAVNQALNNIPASAELSQSTSVYISALQHLNSEVAALSKAGVVFNSGYAKILFQFGKGITQFATDDSQLLTQQFFANIISNDASGDTIRAAIAESKNTTVVNSAGIQTYNDPRPASAISLAKNQGVSITTYLSQNQ